MIIMFIQVFGTCSEQELGCSQNGFLININEEPSHGKGKRIVGWILAGALGMSTLALGITELALAYDNSPSCTESPESGFAIIAMSGIAIGVGVPFVIVGYSNKRNYEKWEKVNSKGRCSEISMTFNVQF